MQWQPPTKNNPLLYLPLSLGSTVQPIETCTVNESISTQVNATWLSIWNSPQNSNTTLIRKNLQTLLQPLARLTQLAQDTMPSYQKTSAFDLVTDTDIGIEKIIRFWFERHLPSHKLIGEEMKKVTLYKDDIIWYLDPIDGTSNYINQSENYCINLGSTYLGKPYINLAISPRKNETMFQSSAGETSYTFSKPKDNILCTEFLPTNTKESTLFKSLLKETNYNPVQTKALGVSLLEMIKGNITAFYKVSAKPWDIIAGSSILSTSPEWDISLILANRTFSAFSNDQLIIDKLNATLQHDGRLGHLVITLKSQPHIKDSIVTKLKHL